MTGGTKGKEGEGIVKRGKTKEHSKSTKKYEKLKEKDRKTLTNIRRPF